MNDPEKRPARDVLESHLEYGKHGNVEDDLRENYSAGIVALTGMGTYRGYDGMRALAAILRKQLPDAEFTYQTVIQEGEAGFLEWSARSKNRRVDDGADSFVIRDGKIVVQTIHYTVRDRE